MKQTINNLKKVFSVSREYRKYFIFILTTSIIQMLIGIFLPLFTAKQIVLFSENVFQELLLTSLMVLGIGILNDINYFIFKIITTNCFFF